MKLTRAIASAYRAFTRSYDAASASPRHQPWANMAAPARQTDAASPIVSRRSSYAVGSIPLAASLTDTQVSAVFPDMPSIQSGHPDEATARALEDAFVQWSPPMTAFVRGVERSRFVTGEALAIMRTDRRGQLRLQLLSPEQLDRTINRDLADGGRVIAGVETDATDEIVAYWILPDAPDLAFSMIGPATRVAADDVIHIFEMKFPGQRRGLSELACVLQRLNELEKLQDSLLARAGTCALFGAFVQDLEGRGGGFADGTAVDPATLSLEPGVMRILPPGTTVTFPNMPDMADAPTLLRHMQRDICSGVGIPYELATGDLSNTNYSSAKVGMEAYKRRVKALRASILVPHLFEPIWRRWVLLEILAGRFHAPDFARDPEPYFRISFLFTEWAALDPLKDVQADVEALRAGLRSRAEIIAARGRDIADVDAEIAADTFKPIATPQPAAALTQERPQNVPA